MKLCLDSFIDVPGGTWIFCGVLIVGLAAWSLTVQPSSLQTTSPQQFYLRIGSVRFDYGQDSMEIVVLSGPDPTMKRDVVERHYLIMLEDASMREGDRIVSIDERMWANLGNIMETLERLAMFYVDTFESGVKGDSQGVAVTPLAHREVPTCSTLDERNWPYSAVVPSDGTPRSTLKVSGGR